MPWDYAKGEQDPFTGSVGDPVVPTTGNFTLAEEDVQIPGRGESQLHLRRFYNAVEPTVGLFGQGWSTAADVSIEATPEVSATVTFEDGQKRSFAYEDERFEGLSGVFGELVETASGWRLTTTDQQSYTFEALDDSRTAGRITRIADRHGNGTSFQYDGAGELTRMTDDSGRSLVFSINGGKIASMTDPLGRQWSYAYSGNFLTGVTNPRSGTSTYGYDQVSGCMSTLTDPEGILYLENVYEVANGHCRVIEQYDAVGSLATLEYSEGQTVFTDHLGNTTTFTFDEAYRYTSKTDALGQTELFNWSNDYRLLSYTDRRGNTWSYSYDDRGNQTEVQCPVACNSATAFDGENNPTQITDSLGQVTSLEWTSGNLVRVVQADGTRLESSFDSPGQLVSLTDGNGHTTALDYDAQGNLIRLTDPLGHATTFTYDSVGRRLSITDANGNTTALSYDEANNVLTVTDPKGQTSVFEYDLNDRLVRMTDRAGGVHTYEYDANLRLTAQVDPEGHRTEHTYDLMYNRVATLEPRGSLTSYVYDELYRSIEMRDALGQVTRFSYDANGNLLSVTDPVGGVTEHAYEARNLRVRTTDPLGGVTTFEYDALGRLSAAANPRSARTEYTYDALGRLTQLRDALGGIAELAYDPVGNLLNRRDPNGHETLFTYDAANRLVSMVDPEGHAATLTYDSVRNLTSVTNARQATTTFTYDANDNVVALVDALGGEATFAYDAEDRRIAVTDPNGNTTEIVRDLDGLVLEIHEAGGQESVYTYDAGHNLRSFTNAKGNVTARSYDALNRLLLQTDPLGHETSFSYDALGRLTRILDAESNATNYAYDLLGRLTAVTNALEHSTGYNYDAVGNLTAILDANGHATTFEYDLLNRMVKETNAVGSAWRYSYDAAGNLIEKRNARDQVISYSYDRDDMVALSSFPDKPDVSLVYDEAHNAVAMNDGLGLTTNTFDLLNRLTSSTNHVGQEVAYTYDAAGNRTSFRHEDGSLMAYEYDANNRPERIVDPDGNVFRAFYDATHNLVQIEYPNRTRSLMRYDDADRLAAVVNMTDRRGDLISAFRYTLDRVGNRLSTSEVHGLPNAQQIRTKYSYDATYRLVRSDDSFGRFNEYDLDPVGNRLGLSTNYDPYRTPTDVDPYSVTATYDAADRLATSIHSVFGETAYTHDADGNRVRREGPQVWTGADDLLRTDYEYDSENRVTRIANFRQVNSGNWLPRDETTMQYDGLDRLFRRTHDRHQGGGGQKWSDFVYDGLDPVSEHIHPSPQYTNYHRGLNRMLSLREKRGLGQGNLYYYHHDGLGSVSALTKHQGQSVHRYRYTDYGIPVDNNGRAADSSNFTNPHNHFTYTGQEWVEETWMVHFHAREYDPIVGVWNRADDYRGSIWAPITQNRFQMAYSNPARFRDLYGYLPEENDRESSIWLKSHEVLKSGDHHTSVVVFPGDETELREDEVELLTTDSGQNYFTLGAGPSWNRLVSDTNREKDVDLATTVESFKLDLGDRSVDNVARSLLEAQQAYEATVADDSLDYDLWPRPEGTRNFFWPDDSHNSNSFTRGLLNAVGIPAPELTRPAPGFDVPVPTAFFERTPTLSERVFSSFDSAQTSVREFLSDSYRVLNEGWKQLVALSNSQAPVRSQPQASGPGSRKNH